MPLAPPNAAHSAPAATAAPGQGLVHCPGLLLGVLEGLVPAAAGGVEPLGEREAVGGAGDEREADHSISIEKKTGSENRAGARESCFGAQPSAIRRGGA